MTQVYAIGFRPILSDAFLWIAPVAAVASAATLLWSAWDWIRRSTPPEAAALAVIIAASMLWISLMLIRGGLAPAIGEPVWAALGNSPYFGEFLDPY
ncbi:MAG: hypothetical protein AAGL49_10660 [Pseudomonadota bacterium]